MADSTAPADQPGTTRITVTRSIPLGKVTDTARTGLRRIVPASETPKPPVAAFDSAL